MSRDPATMAFVRFRDSGEPQQLGVVFDLLAPELLLVAARLLPREGDTADLVQQTFVTAIQQRRKFDASRAVAPWLVGILLQHVRRERRRLRRRVDAARLRQPMAADPAAIAATRDQAEAVRQAVARMPQPYRQVLQLHLVHGLSVSAVAASLERPFRTVQSQLRRGLQQLQRALPAAVVLPWRDASLAMIRAQVLRSAVAVGWLALPGLRLVALLAFLTLPCALVAASWSRGDVVPTLDAPARGIVAAFHAGPSASWRGSSGAAQRVLVQDPQPVSRVRLRVLAAEDQAPLQGVQLRCTVRERSPDGSCGVARELPAATSDAKGEVTVTVPRGSQFLVDLTLHAEGRQELWRQVSGTDREECGYGDITLWPLVTGRIHVIDQHGAPLPFVDVRIGAGAAQSFMPLRPIGAQTDDEGWTDRFEMPCGDVRVGVSRLPLDFASAGEAQAELGVHGGDCELVLQRPDPATLIAGRIVDERGEPIAAAWVQLTRASDGVPVTLGCAPCDGDGRFAVLVPSGQGGPFRLRGGVGQGAGQTGEQTYERGARDALLQLRWPRGLALTVIDDQTGEPIEDYGVACFHVDPDKHGWISGDRKLQQNGRHAAGQTFVDGLEAGDNRLLVLPADDDLLPSGYLQVHIAESGVTKLMVRLHRPEDVVVHVAFADGKPAVGSRVHLQAKLSGGDNWTRLLPLPYGSSHWQGRLVLATAMTDDRGLARLAWQPWHETLILRAEGPGHQVGELQLDGVVPGTAMHELRVAPGATVLGQASNMDRLPRLAVDPMGKPLPDLVQDLRPAVVLRNCADGELFCDPAGKAFPIVADGSFVCRDVPPGRWQVLLQFVRFAGGIATGSTEVLQQPLAEVVTVTGMQTTAAIDLGQAVPGSLAGRVFLDGQPVRARDIVYWERRMDHLGRWRDGGSGLGGGQFLQADGSYRIGRVFPGQADIEAILDGRHYHLFEPIAIAPGQHRQVDLQYRHLVARIRLLHADGSPVANRLARVGADLCSVDGDGWLVLDPAPALHLDVTLYPAGIDRHALWQFGSDDPRVRTMAVGTVDLDPAQRRSEHHLVVGGPRR